MSQSPHAPRLSTLILLSAVGVLPVNIFLPSLPRMAADLEVDYGVISLALAAYAGVSAALQITLGPLSDRFGRRPVILWCLGIFIVASVGCAIAPDALSFLACRMVQAMIAPTYAVALAVIRDTTSREQAASTIGFVAMSWAVAPMVAPSLGGLLGEVVGWRAIFGFLGLAGALIFALCWVDLRETNLTPSNSIGEQFRAYPELLTSGRFWAYASCMAFSVGAFYAFLTGAPLAAAAYGLSPAILGLFMGSITGGFMFGSFLSGRFAAGFPLTTMIIAGRLVACGGLLLGLGLYLADVAHILALFGPCIFVGIANGLTMPSANAGAISVRPKLTGSAAGLAGAITITGGAILSSATGALLTPETAGLRLFLVMLASAVAALAAGMLAHILDRQQR